VKKADNIPDNNFNKFKHTFIIFGKQYLKICATLDSPPCLITNPTLPRKVDQNKQKIQKIVLLARSCLSCQRQ